MISFHKSFLKTFPPEVAHYLTIQLLKIKPKLKHKYLQEDRKLYQHLWGLDFNNPIGLSAGFDKNAEVVMPLIDLGFGFVEVGTVTPHPQKGNDKPRVFRLFEDRAIINHLGFNNLGLDVARKNLQKLNLNTLSRGIVGINIGANKDSKNIIEDYCVGLEKLGPLAHYITINISSPNTPGLRDLQNRGRIENLVKSLYKLKDKNENLGAKAILFKISPDIEDKQIRDIALMSLAFDIDGLIISNSTIERPSTLVSQYRNEIGGLSGKPLFLNSTLLLKKMYNFTNGRIPLIGVGGISNGIECYEKIKSGASLVQLYTALVYQGPSIIDKIKNEILSCLKIDGFQNIKEVIGIDV